ncbi:MAG: Mov34/MPN/PAD-1 family protein [Candidatus Hodarchaeota archaeon]
MEYTEEKIKEINAKPVKILPGAYQKMLMHVLRFGSLGLPRDQWRECYGMCVGYFENEQITISDALPTTHGTDIGVEFVEENYVFMAEFQDQLDKINEEIEEKDKKLFIVGWYHSHPGMERFLSSVDVRNQISYQPPDFPFGVAIVFDNTCVFQEDANSDLLDLGLKIFRLDDPTSTEINIPFSEVLFERELLDQPALLDILKNEMQMVENIQKRVPFIKEFRETPSIFGNFKIPTTEALKEAGTGITPEDRSEITILPLAELDQVFTTGMQLFIEKYSTLSQEEKSNFATFIEQGIMPMMDKVLTTFISGLNDWTKKLRVDIDKRVNFGLSALNTMKSTLLEIKGEFLDYLKEKSEQDQEESRALAKSYNEIEVKLKKILQGYTDTYNSIFANMNAEWKAKLDNAQKLLGQTELAKIQAELEAISQKLGKGTSQGDAGPEPASKPSLESLEEILTSHLQKVGEVYQHAQDLKDATRPPDLLGNFVIPSTKEIEDMSPFIDESDDVSKDFLSMGDIPISFKEGLTQFVEFYEGLADDQKTNFQVINEKGIQPFSDMVVSKLVRGINQWTVNLRDDVDKRVNLLVSVANEMQRTMRNIQSDYLEFFITASDPAARIQRVLEKTLADVETNSLSVFNNVLSYLEQVLQNLAYVYQTNLERQNQLLDEKELKKISKTVEQIKKSI